MILSRWGSCRRGAASEPSLPYRREKERPPCPRLPGPRNHTHVLVHWECCLQGLEIPATESARADSDIWPEQPFRWRAAPQAGPALHMNQKKILLFWSNDDNLGECANDICISVSSLSNQCVDLIIASRTLDGFLLSASCFGACLRYWGIFQRSYGGP